MIVNHKGYKAKVVFDRYTHNDNTAITLIGDEGTEYEGEVLTVATANGATLPKDTVGIKTWSENKGIDEALIKAKVIEPEPLGTQSSGYVEIINYKLSQEAIKNKKEQEEGN